MDFPWMGPTFSPIRPSVKLMALRKGGRLTRASTISLYFSRILLMILFLHPTLDNASQMSPTEALRRSFWRHVCRVSYRTSVLLDGWFDSWLEMMLSTLSSNFDNSANENCAIHCKIHLDFKTFWQLSSDTKGQHLYKDQRFYLDLWPCDLKINRSHIL